MGENIQYRIKEVKGIFRVQIYAYEEKGIFWNKRKKWSWEETNAWGGPWEYFIAPQPPSKSFNSLEKAQEQVKKWQNKFISIYHTV